MKKEGKFDEIAELLKALAHPIRLCIVKGLLENSCNVSNMQECLNIPQSTVSQHISILKTRGIIKGTRNGTEINYSVNNPLIKELIGVLFLENKDS